MLKTINKSRLIPWLFSIYKTSWVELFFLLFTGSIYSGLVLKVGGQLEGLSLTHTSSLGLAALSVLLLRSLLHIAADFISIKLKKKAYQSGADKLEENFSLLRSKASPSEMTFLINQNFVAAIETAIHGTNHFLSTLFIILPLLFFAPAIDNSQLFNLTLLVGFGTLISLALQFFLRKASLSIDSTETENFKLQEDLIHDFESLKTSRKIFSWKKDYEKNLILWAQDQKKIFTLKQLSNNLNWGGKYLFVLFIISPIAHQAQLSNSSIYWLYILLGLCIQLFQSIFLIGQAQPHFLKVQPLFERNNFEDKRCFNNQLKFQLDNFEFFFGTSKGLGPQKLINMQFCTGDKVGVIGKSGAGKTTFLKSLLGFHQNFQGTLNTPNLNFSWAFVPQTPHKYENIKLKDFLNTNSRQEIEEIAEYLDLESFFASIQWNLNFHLGPKGITPSIGQYKRLSLLKELLQKPDILILDEPTAHLDTYASQKVLLYLNETSKDRITFVAEHDDNFQKNYQPSQIVTL